MYKFGKRILGMVLTLAILIECPLTARAEIKISAPSAILIEATSGKVVYDKNSLEKRSPASITKIMTLYLIFEKLAEGKVKLSDEVMVSAHAAGMGGSQVYLAEGEVQTLETMIKCIAVSSGNDASVAVAEYLAGSEEAFVEQMNQKTSKLGMINTHFVDCCGLSDSDDHYTCAADIALLTKALINNYPEIFQYTTIWMEDITHETKQGTSVFTLTSTNKLLKQYPYTTGLKTGSTSKAGFCISATASKDGMDMIAVVMGSENGLSRFQDAQVLLSYGFNMSSLFVDPNEDVLPKLPVKGSVSASVPVAYKKAFRFVDVEGNALKDVQKQVELPEFLEAPLQKGDEVGRAVYTCNGKKIGSVPILCAEDVEKAEYRDYVRKAAAYFLLP